MQQVVRYKRTGPLRILNYLSIALGSQSAAMADTKVETLSLGGVFIHTPEPPPVGSTLNMLLDMQNGDVRARAIVRRVAPSKGMGIEFISMTPEDRARLNKQLRQILSS